HVSEAITGYVLDIAQASRAHPRLSLGLSTRGVIALVKAARITAALRGSDFALILLTAVLAVTGIWSSEPGLSDVWRLPAALLLIGLGYEAVMIRRAAVVVSVETATRAFLGRQQAAVFA